VEISNRFLKVLWALGSTDGDADGNFDKHFAKGCIEINFITGEVSDSLSVMRRTHTGLMIAAFLVSYKKSICLD